MKRLVLGLVMAGGLAFLAAPMANAAALGECGKTYAFQVHGTEPELSSDSALHYIVGIGEISFNAAGTSGATGCTVSHLELIYNDNAVLTLNAAGAHCDDGGSALGTGVPCFDGGSHQNVQGTLTPSPFWQWRTAADDRSQLHLGKRRHHTRASAFGLHAAGEHRQLGGSRQQRAGCGSAGPTSPPPTSPVLVITLQKQSSTNTLPVAFGTAPTWGCKLAISRATVRLRRIRSTCLESRAPSARRSTCTRSSPTVRLAEARASAPMTTSGIRPALLKTTATRSLRSRPTFPTGPATTPPQSYIRARSAETRSLALRSRSLGSVGSD